MIRCIDCKHWQLFRAARSDPTAPDADKSVGECRRYPPVIDPSTAQHEIVTDTALAWAWPVTHHDHGCGEGKAYVPQPLGRLLAWRGT